MDNSTRISPDAHLDFDNQQCTEFMGIKRIPVPQAAEFSEAKLKVTSNWAPMDRDGYDDWDNYFSADGGAVRAENPWLPSPKVSSIGFA